MRESFFAAVLTVFLCVDDCEPAQSQPAPEPQGYGSCYELKPLCPPGQDPVCVCNTNNSCNWACGK